MDDENVNKRKEKEMELMISSASFLDIRDVLEESVDISVEDASCSDPDFVSESLEPIQCG